MVHAMLTSFAKINTYYKRNFNTDCNNNKIIINNHINNNVISVPQEVNEVINEPIENVIINDVIVDAVNESVSDAVVAVGTDGTGETDETDETVGTDGDAIVNTVKSKRPMTNAERQRLWYANNKLNEDFKKARERIENTDERKARRYVRELNQGKRSIDDITRRTIAKYQISFINGKYVSGIL